MFGGNKSSINRLFMLLWINAWELPQIRNLQAAEIYRFSSKWQFFLQAKELRANLSRLLNFFSIFPEKKIGIEELRTKIKIYETLYSNLELKPSSWFLLFYATWIITALLFTSLIFFLLNKAIMESFLEAGGIFWFAFILLCFVLLTLLIWYILIDLLFDAYVAQNLEAKYIVLQKREIKFGWLG